MSPLVSESVASSPPSEELTRSSVAGVGGESKKGLLGESRIGI